MTFVKCIECWVDGDDDGESATTTTTSDAAATVGTFSSNLRYMTLHIRINILIF